VQVIRPAVVSMTAVGSPDWLRAGTAETQTQAAARQHMSGML